MTIKWLSGKKIEYATGDTLPTTGVEAGTEAKNITTGDESTFIGGVWVTDPGGSGNITSLDDIPGVDLTTDPPDNNDVLTYSTSGTKWVPAPPPGAGGGEANTVTNVGTGEGTLAKAKVGVDIPLKTLKQGTNVTLTNNTNDVTITSTYPPDATDAVKGIVELSLSNGSESAGGRAVQDNDTRLTDSRTPTAHVHSGADITSGTVPAAQLPNANNTTKGAVITSNSNGSESAGTKVILDNDTRLTNSRTPISHNHSGADITSGTVGPTVGGTGKTTFTQHALLKGGASNTFTEIPVGTENHVLSVVSGTPAYRSLDSERTGKATETGDGITTDFEITHGLGAEPSYAFIDCASHAINRTWTKDGTKLYISFVSPIPNTETLEIYWRVIA